jgi:predicted dehydrogenase
MKSNRTRRQFLCEASAGAAALWLGSGRLSARAYEANEKLNVGVIGAGGMQGGFHLGAAGSQNVAALCDVDERILGEAAKKFPMAKTYHDFRKMIEAKGLDAVIVSTPDHTHAAAASAAMKAGMHVYCEKPLAHDLFEVRALIETARREKRVTQMGTQIHAEDNYRRVVELVQAGAIGAVREAHAWVGRDWGKPFEQGDRPADTPPVPPYLHWDLWLGPAPERPYHSEYLPTNWRRWWDFGSGTLGDMGCHVIDCIFWALKLRAPASVAAEGPKVHAESAPVWVHVTWEFKEPAPLTLHWWDGGKYPDVLPARKKREFAGLGMLFVGEKGMLVADYGRRELLPEEKFDGFAPPAPTIAPSIGHHNEWFEAIKGRGQTLCNFDYSGTLTETVLLGLAAYRSGQKLSWDAASLKVGSAEAQKFVRRDYRKGWTL